ncbi:hypothetical protein LSH36_879g00002 [Paralvinella palmiformis]|uniref:G-protein coupled receptors family 1 profile domain-containing protein n=1 Tax=Paralvinella palmiformis TaxID=53620 RepID=A0AAD9IZ85_9ANNE|nr:hypothetical protein LSH36_879g00002 [Paralvinella palmiformis]
MDHNISRDIRVRITPELTTVSKDVATCGLIFGSICIISALFGNSLIIAAVTRDRNLRQRQNVFLVSWAICELIMVFMRDVFLIIVYAIGEWPFGRTMTVINLCIFMARDSFAINHVVAITVYRYAMIVHPLIYRILIRTRNLIIIVINLFLMPVVLMLIIDFDIYNKQYKFITKGMYAMKEDNGTLVDVPMVTMTAVFVSLTLYSTLMAVCYGHLYIFIRKSSKRVERWTRETNQFGQHENGTNKISMKRNIRELKFIKTMIIIFVMFIFSYFSLPIMLMANKTFSFSHWAYLPLVMINWFSSSVSWIMYGFTHDGFRKAFLTMLRCSKNRIEVSEQSITAVA